LGDDPYLREWRACQKFFEWAGIFSCPFLLKSQITVRKEFLTAQKLFLIVYRLNSP